MLSASPCLSNVAFLGAAEHLWDLTSAAGGAVAAMESILGAGCGVEEGKQKAEEGKCGAPAHLCHWDEEGWMASARGPKATTSLQLCSGVSGVRKEGRVVVWGGLKGQG